MLASISARPSWPLHANLTGLTSISPRPNLALLTLLALGANRPLFTLRAGLALGALFTLRTLLARWHLYLGNLLGDLSPDYLLYLGIAWSAAASREHQKHQ